MNELPGEIPFRALERRARARHLERLLLLTPALEIVHRRTDLLGRVRDQRERCGKDDQTIIVDAAFAVSHGQLFAREGPDASRSARPVGQLGAGNVSLDGLENVGGRAAVRPRVHEARAADRGRDPPKRLHAGKAGVGRGDGDIAEQRARLSAHARPLDLDGGEVLAQQDDDAAHAAVAHEQVTAVAHHQDGNRAHRADVEHAHERLGGLGGHEDIGRAADLEGGMRPHGLAHHHVVLARRHGQGGKEAGVEAVELVHRAPPYIHSV